MVAQLEKAFAEAGKLPAERQASLAALILEEIRSEQHWDKQFAESQGELGRLAEEAIAEYDAGKTRPLNSDRDLTHD